MAENYKNLKVKELQDLLQKNGLPHSGKKEELIERLVKHDEEQRTAQEFASLEEEFGELEEFDDSKINLEEIPESEFTDKPEGESTENQKSQEESKKEEKEAPKETITTTKPNSTFKFTPIVFDKKPATTAATTKTATAPAPTTKAAAPATEIKGSDEDKRAERAKRFGIQLNETAKKDIRAQRFGLADKKQAPVDKKSKKLGIDPEVLKKRAERFGLSAGKPAASKGKVTTVLSAEDEEKKRKRAERFALDAQKKQKVD